MHAPYPEPSRGRTARCSKGGSKKRQFLILICRFHPLILTYIFLDTFPVSTWRHEESHILWQCRVHNEVVNEVLWVTPNRTSTLLSKQTGEIIPYFPCIISIWHVGKTRFRKTDRRFAALTDLPLGEVAR